VSLEAQLEPLPFAGPADSTDQTGRVAQYLAQEVARRLALEVEQIGLVGASHIEWPRAAASTTPSGSESSETQRFGLQIIYAWPRRAGESAPVYGQFGPRGKARATLEPHFDEAAALAILKKYRMLSSSIPTSPGRSASFSPTRVSSSVPRACPRRGTE